MELKNLLNDANRAFEESEIFEDYASRHGIESAGVLTVTNDDTAGEIAHYLAPRIEGKTVIEIGGGIGLLSHRDKKGHQMAPRERSRALLREQSPANLRGPSSAGFRA